MIRVSHHRLPWWPGGLTSYLIQEHGEDKTDENDE